MKAREIQSRSIEILRFPLAVMVVCIHCYYFNSQNINVSSVNGGDFFIRWFINICSIVLTDCAVPMFYVISGYLFFFKQSGYTCMEYKSKMRMKCLMLLLPYLIWNVIGIMAYPNTFLESSMLEKLLGFWSQKMEYGSWSGPWNGPLWFMRDLFIVMLFSPVISIMIKRIGFLFPLLLFVPYYFGYEAVFPGFTSVSFLFFSIGSYLGIKKPDFSDSLNMARVAILTVASVVLFTLRIFVMGGIVTESARLVHVLWIFSSMSIYFCMARKIAITTNNFNQWKLLASSSFVIFSMHSLIIGRISSTFLFLVGKHNVGYVLTLVFYILTITFSVAICYITHLFILRNSTTALLFEGGRKK